MLAACGGGGGGGRGSAVPETGLFTATVSESTSARNQSQSVQDWIDTLVREDDEVVDATIISRTVSNDGLSASTTLRIVNDDSQSLDVAFTFRLSGADVSQFQLQAVTAGGNPDIVVRAKSALDFENPSDSNDDNIYELKLTATTVDQRISSEYRSITDAFTIQITDDPSDNAQQPAPAPEDSSFNVGDSLKSGQTLALSGSINGSSVDATVTWTGSRYSYSGDIGGVRLGDTLISAKTININGVVFDRSGKLTALPDGVTATLTTSGGSSAQADSADQVVYDFTDSFIEVVMIEHAGTQPDML